MARQISNEEESGSLGLGGSGVAMPGYPAPTSTPGISYDSTQVTTTGVEYNIGLSQKGMQTLDTLGMQFKKQMVVDIVTSDNAELTVQGQQYLKDNPSGEGYHKFVLDLQQEQMDRAISKAPDRETRLLLANHYKASRNSLFESSYNKELEVGTKFLGSAVDIKNEKLLTEVYMNPSTAKENSVIYELNLSCMKPLLGAKYEAYRTKELNRFWSSTAHGDINIDPVNAKKKLEAGEYPGLTAEERARLVVTADSTINSRIDRAYKLEKKAELQLKKEDNSTMIRMDTLIAKRKLTEEVLDNTFFHFSDNREKIRNRLLRSQEAENKKIEIQTEITSKVNKGESITSYPKEEVIENYIGAVMQLGSDADHINKATEVKARKSGHAINPYIDDVTNALERGDAKTAYEAAQGLTMVLNENPDAVKGIEPKVKMLASYIANHCSPIGQDAVDMNKTVKQARTILSDDRSVESYKISQAAMARDKVLERGDINVNLNQIVRETSRYIQGIPLSRFGDAFSANESSIPVNVRYQMEVDYKNSILEAYNHNYIRSDAKIYAAQELSRMYGVTNAAGKYRYIKCPPEKMYPERTPESINKGIINSVRSIIDSKRKAGDNSITFVEPDPKESINIPQIRTMIKGKLETRDVSIDKIESSGNDRDTVAYKAFFMIDEGNEMTKVHLNKPEDPVITPITFGKRK